MVKSIDDIITERNIYEKALKHLIEIAQNTINDTQCENKIFCDPIIVICKEALDEKSNID